MWIWGLRDGHASLPCSQCSFVAVILQTPSAHARLSSGLGLSFIVITEQKTQEKKKTSIVVSHVLLWGIKYGLSIVKQQGILNGSVREVTSLILNGPNTEFIWILISLKTLLKGFHKPGCSVLSKALSLSWAQCLAPVPFFSFCSLNPVLVHETRPLSCRPVLHIALSGCSLPG